MVGDKDEPISRIYEDPDEKVKEMKWERGRRGLGYLCIRKIQHQLNQLNLDLITPYLLTTKIKQI